jgi:hypothetical protein
VNSLSRTCLFLVVVIASLSVLTASAASGQSGTSPAMDPFDPEPSFPPTAREEHYEFEIPGVEVLDGYGCACPGGPESEVIVEVERDQLLKGSGKAYVYKGQPSEQSPSPYKVVNCTTSPMWGTAEVAGVTTWSWSVGGSLGAEVGGSVRTGLLSSVLANAKLGVTVGGSINAGGGKSDQREWGFAVNWTLPSCRSLYIYALTDEYLVSARQSVGDYIFCQWAEDNQLMFREIFCKRGTVNAEAINTAGETWASFEFRLNCPNLECDDDDQNPVEIRVVEPEEAHSGIDRVKAKAPVNKLPAGEVDDGVDSSLPAR